MTVLDPTLPVLEPVELTWATAPRPRKRKGRCLVGVKRVSKRGRRNTDDWMTEPQQIELCEGYAESRGDYIGIWVDETDSVSGGTVDRTGLKQALSLALSDDYDGVIVAKANRFARTRRAGEGLILDLVEAGKSFVAVYNNLDTAGGKLDRGQEVYLDALLRHAQWEREDAMANWEDVRHRHTAKGVAVHPCYGYEKGPDRVLRPIRAEARTVVRIFEMRAAGRSWAKIADELNRRGIPSPGNSLEWYPQAVTGIIHNRKYLGELRYGDAFNPKAHKPIVTMDLWEAAHAVKVSGSGDVNEAMYYMLAGMVRCAGCGGRMTGVNITGGSGPVKVTTRYYRCRKRYSWGVCPSPCQVNADQLEAAVVADFERRTLHRLKASSRKRNAALDNAVAAVEQARAELRAYNQRTAAAREALGDEDFEEGLNLRVADVEKAQEAESEARAAVIGVKLPASLRDDWATMEDTDRGALLSRVYYCVAVRRAFGNQSVEQRMRLWVVGDTDRPKFLPGRTVGRVKGKRKPNAITPIKWRGTPKN